MLGTHLISPFAGSFLGLRQRYNTSKGHGNASTSSLFRYPDRVPGIQAAIEIEKSYGRPVVPHHACQVS